MLERKVEVPAPLSRLFNLVLNAEKINSPYKIGFCKDIYESYFRETKSHQSFSGAVSYYKRHLDKNIPGGSYNIELAKQELFMKSIKYMTQIAKIFVKDTYERKIAFNILNQERFDCVDYQPIKEIFHLFHRRHNSMRLTLDKIEEFINSLKSFTVFELEDFSNHYIENLVTYDSFIGTWVENDIKKFLSKKLNTIVKDSSKEEDKKGIDGWINGKALSIKSINYKRSMYRKSRRTDIAKVINGPIIFYRLDFSLPNSYEIEDLDKILAHYR